MVLLQVRAEARVLRQARNRLNERRIRAWPLQVAMILALVAAAKNTKNAMVLLKL